MASDRPPGGSPTMAQSPGSPNTSSMQGNPASPPNVMTPQRLARSPSILPEQQLPPRDSVSDEEDGYEKPEIIEVEKLQDFLGVPDGARGEERFFLDPSGELTYDITTVDVITVPCPGGDRLRTWNREGLLGRYFGAPSMRDAEVSNNNDRPSTSWVRQGLRREADKARILLYAHPDLAEGMTLNRLAEEFLQALLKLRTREDQTQRPLLILGHSIGGLVAKMALVRASRDTKYQDILHECYGVAFFGTPHQGSSYFAMHSLAGSIQTVLQLAAPLPETLTADLRVGNSLLAHIDEDFKEIASDMKIWTFYETIDSRLSGRSAGVGIARTATGGRRSSRVVEGENIYFTAPLTSVKSAILGMRQERIFPLQSDHANVASFGRHNVPTMRLFLRQIAAQVERADANATSSDGEQGSARWAMPNLEQKVNIEIHGFFDDAVGGSSVVAAVRAWSTRLPLREFLNKGPEECLNERLNEVDGSPGQGQFLTSRGRTSVAQMDCSVEHSPSPTRVPAAMPAAPPPIMTVKDALGIDSQIVEPPTPPVVPMSPVMRALNSLPAAGPATSPKSAPVGPLTPPSFCAPSPPNRYAASSIQHASPILRAQFEQDLAIDRLSPQMRGRRATAAGMSLSRSASLGSDGASRFKYRDFPPFSLRSRSTFGDAVPLGAEDDDGMEVSPALPEAVFGMRGGGGGHRHGVIDAAAAGVLTKPEVQSKKFTWIHLPYNNPAWVKSILQTIQVCSGLSLSHLYGPEFWATKHTRGRHSQHYAYYAKPGCYFTAPRALSPLSASPASPSMSPFTGNQGMYTTLFFPYLHFDTYKRLLRRRNLILQRLNQGRSRPVPSNVAKTDSLEMQVIWEYLGNDPPINCRRTLDQFGYPSLRDTRSRDDDQMLYKLTKERLGLHGHRQQLHSQGSSTGNGSSRSGNAGGGSFGWKERLTRLRGDEDDDQAGEEDVLNGNVLMVDQLWLWIINKHTVLTFFPKREGDPIEGPLFQQADLRDSIFNEVNVDLTRQCENALDLAALSVLHAVTVLLDGSSHPDLEVFRIFEEAISVLTEKLTSSLKEFRTEGVRDKSFDFEPVENRLRFIRARHKEEGRRAERENRDNTSALLELRDIEDELVTMLHLFERQSKVIASMHAIYTRAELREHTVNGRLFLSEALKKVTEYIQQAEEMIRRVRDTRDDYDKLLQMVQRQAQVDEVRLSRLHADVASAQSRSVMIFTIFTVIFLPLTFFTGLFGMNTREWGGANNLSLRTIGMISLPSSVFLIVASLIVAWSTNVRKVFHYAVRLFRHLQEYFYVFLLHPMARVLRALVGYVAWRNDAANEGDVDASRLSGGVGGLRQEASDFWERHRLERDREYRIPEVNRRDVRKGWSVRAKKENKSK